MHTQSTTWRVVEQAPAELGGRTGKSENTPNGSWNGIAGSFMAPGRATLDVTSWGNGLRLAASSNTRGLALGQCKGTRCIKRFRDGRTMPMTPEGVQEHEVLLETELTTGIYMTI